MKAGTESKGKVYAAVALGIVAVLSVSWALLPRGPAQAPASGVAAPGGKIKSANIESLDPQLRLDLLANAEEVKYEGRGRNIFRASTGPEIIEKVKVSPLIGNQTKGPTAQGYTPPPPPPINLKFFGLANSKGEKPKAFLAQGDDVWIAREGDVVNRHYKVVRISPREVEVEDLLNNHRENIPLTQG